MDKCLTSVHFPIVRQIACQYHQPENLQADCLCDNLIIDETGWEDYSLWWSPSLEWGEGPLDGADQFYRVNIEYISLKTDSDVERKRLE